MKVKVKNCSECPFFHSGEEYTCIRNYAIDFTSIWDWDDPKHHSNTVHEDCLLRWYDIEVSLENKMG